MLRCNVATAEGLVRDAAAGGARARRAPELFPCYGSEGRAMREAAEPLEGPILTDRFGAIARDRVDLGARRVGGGAQRGAHREHVGADRPNGELVASYRKIHLFDVEFAGQPPIRESGSSTGGSARFRRHRFGRVGFSICYDGRFPELYRGLVALGTEILIVPSAFTAVTGEAHWEVLLRARAIEDQCFVVAPAQWGPWGPPEDGRRCYGNSLVVDPWGRALARAPAEGNAARTADLDLRELRCVSSLPALAHRRLGTVC